MTWRFIHIQNEEMWISGELNTLVQCLFNSYSKPEGALAQKLLTYGQTIDCIKTGQTHTAILVAELNKKQKHFLLMKREDNKHTIAKINKLYEKCSTDWHII